jgi:hypothetical protein
VTPDEARKLVGGYATGSLSESERKLLYEAALEDQTLFDELAREHELKELLEEPGARERLVAALTPTPRRRPWPLMWSGAALATVAIVIVSFLIFRSPKPVEIAQVPVTQPVPAAPPAAEPAKPSPAQEPKRDAPATSKQKRAANVAAPGAVAVEAPQAPVTHPVPATPPAAERAKSLPAQAPKQKASADTAAAAPAAVPVARPPSQSSNETVQVQAQSGFVAPAGGGGARPAAARGLAMAPAKPRRFGFDYTVEPETLILRFATDGWLSLHFSPGDDTIALAHVTAGQVRREPIPNNATEAAIVVAVEAQTDPTLGVNLTRTDKSGTVEDASGKRIEFLLKFY